MSSWRPLLWLLSQCPFFNKSPRNSTENRPPVYIIYGRLIFEWVTMTEFCEEFQSSAPTMATVWHARNNQHNSRRILPLNLSTPPHPTAHHHPNPPAMPSLQNNLHACESDVTEILLLIYTSIIQIIPFHHRRLVLADIIHICYLR